MIAPAQYLSALHGRQSYEVVAITGDERLRLGIFDDPNKAEGAALAYDGKASLYVTVNEVSRYAANPDKLQQARSRCTSADMRSRSHWYLDSDSVRPNAARTNATEQEHGAALQRRDDVAKWMQSRIGAEPLVCGDSGNGGLLIYRLAHGATEIQRAHEAVCEMFSDGAVKLDERVTNLDRLHPLAGTMKCKGAHTSARPQRRTDAHINTNAGEVTAEALAYLAQFYKPAEREARSVDLVDHDGQHLPQAAIDFLTVPPGDGERNAGLFAASRAMRDAGLSEQMAHDVLTPVALAIGFTLRKCVGVIASTFKHAPLREDVSDYVSQWRAAVQVASSGWKLQARPAKQRVAEALAEIVSERGKREFYAPVREVSARAVVSKASTAKHLNSLRRDDKLIVCTNLGKRDTERARTYQLAAPFAPVTERTLIEPRGAVGGGNARAEGRSRGSMSVRSVTALHLHEFASTKIGAVCVDVLTALVGPLTLRQLQTRTKRRQSTLAKSLAVLAEHHVIFADGDTYRLVTDEAKTLAAFDLLAVKFNAVGRREALRSQYQKERWQFHEIAHSDTSVADTLRSRKRNRQATAATHALRMQAKASKRKTARPVKPTPTDDKIKFGESWKLPDKPVKVVTI